MIAPRTVCIVSLMLASLAMLTIAPGCRPRLSSGRAGGYYEQKAAERQAAQDFSDFYSNPAFDMFTRYDPTDPDMVSAMKKARSSVAEFVDRMKNPRSGDKEFSVLVCVSDEKWSKNDLEPFWLQDLKWDGKTFTGVLDRDPHYVRTVSFGEQITIDPEDISDWGYVANGRVNGAYTIKYLRGKLSPDDRKQFDRMHRKYGGLKWD